MRTISTVPRDSNYYCIVTPPLLENYNLEWYRYSKRTIQMLRGQFYIVRGDLDSLLCHQVADTVHVQVHNST